MARGNSQTSAANYGFKWIWFCAVHAYIVIQLQTLNAMGNGIGLVTFLECTQRCPCKK